MGITKSESHTLIDAASKLNTSASSASNALGAPPRSAKLSAATTVNHAAHRGHILFQFSVRLVVLHAVVTGVWLFMTVGNCGCV